MIDHLDWQKMFKATGFSDNEYELLDNYFYCFAQPEYKLLEDESVDVGEMPCLKCNIPLLGGKGYIYGGGFIWDIMNGEGYCGKCSWPARANHEIKDQDGKVILEIENLILQYHPDFVEKVAEANQ